MIVSCFAALLEVVGRRTFVYFGEKIGKYDHLVICPFSVFCNMVVISSFLTSFCFVFVDWANMKTLRNRPVDYGCRYFGEMCYFLFSLLSKVYAVSSLPMSEAWESYVDKLDEPFIELPDSEILSDNHRITDAMALTPSSAVRTFRADAKKFLVALIAAVRSSICATLDLGRSLSCFCPDILLQGG